MTIEDLGKVKYNVFMGVIGSKFSSDEIEDIEDAAVATGIDAVIDPDKSRVIVHAFADQNVDYQLKKIDNSYVLVSTDGEEVGRVASIMDIISLLEVVLNKPRQDDKP